MCKEVLFLVSITGLPDQRLIVDHVDEQLQLLERATCPSTVIKAGTLFARPISDQSWIYFLASASGNILRVIYTIGLNTWDAVQVNDAVMEGKLRDRFMGRGIGERLPDTFSVKKYFEVRLHNFQPGLSPFVVT